MLLLGHIGITAFAFSMLYLSILGGIIGALLPDVIDKGLLILGYAPCGRFIAHSIFFFPVAGLVTYAITRNKKLAVAVALGAFLHLIQDMHDNVPFFYPLKTYAFFATCGQIKILFTQYIIITESIGAFLLIFIAVFKSQFLYLRKLLWGNLKKVGINGRFIKNVQRKKK